MAEIRTTHLMTLSVAGLQPIGAIPNRNRRVGLVAGGKFAGAQSRIIAIGSGSHPPEGPVYDSFPVHDSFEVL